MQGKPFLHAVKKRLLRHRLANETAYDIFRFEDKSRVPCAPAGLAALALFAVLVLERLAVWL
jgi:hypothetical protein